MHKLSTDCDGAINTDLLDGVPNIAAFIGLSHRRTYYLLEKGYLPGFKLGTKWCARKTTLHQEIERKEKGVA